MLSSHVARYVALHRGLGLKFNEQQRLLHFFAEYAWRRLPPNPARPGVVCVRFIVELCKNPV